MKTITKLSDKRKKFAFNYATGMSGKDAAISAGYSEKGAKANAYVALQDPNVKQILTKANNSCTKALEKNIYETFNRNVELLTEIAEDNKKVDPRVSVASISELNKMFGNYSPEKHINLNINQNADVIKVREMLDKFVAEKQKEY